MRGAVDTQERGDDLCANCTAAVTWESLEPGARDVIDAAIRQGPIHGLMAMRDGTPPIRLPHSVGVLHYRYRSGVRSDAAAGSPPR